MIQLKGFGNSIKEVLLDEGFANQIFLSSLTLRLQYGKLIEFSWLRELWQKKNSNPLRLMNWIIRNKILIKLISNNKTRENLKILIG